MADHRPDRHEYLARVAGHLRLPGPVAADVLEEIDAHIADTTASLIDEGLTPDRGEREALARLGDPGELGDGIRRAQQTRRRLFVAAGYGVIVAVRGFVWGWLFAGAITGLATILATLVLVNMARLTGMFLSGSAWNSWLGVPYVMFAVGYAGYRVPGAMVARSMRRIATLRWPTAIIGGTLVGILTIFGLRMAMDAGTFWILLLAPIAFAVGALLSADGRSGAPVRIRVTWRTVVVAVAMLTLAQSVAGFAMMRPDFSTFTAEPIGPSAYDVLPAGVRTIGGGGTTIDGVTRSLAFDPPVVSSGWSAFRLELWRSDDRGLVASDATAPVRTIDMTPTEPASFTGEMPLPVTRERLTYADAVTALGPDGRRYVLSGPDGGYPSPPWTGTAWEWLTTP